MGDQEENDILWILSNARKADETHETFGGTPMIGSIKLSATNSIVAEKYIYVHM